MPKRQPLTTKKAQQGVVVVVAVLPSGLLPPPPPPYRQESRMRRIDEEGGISFLPHSSVKEGVSFSASLRQEEEGRSEADYLSNGPEEKSHFLGIITEGEEPPPREPTGPYIVILKVKA